MLLLGVAARLKAVAGAARRYAGGTVRTDALC
jgi:hypothetical protein